MTDEFDWTENENPAYAAIASCLRPGAAALRPGEQTYHGVLRMPPGEWWGRLADKVGEEDLVSTGWFEAPNGTQQLVEPLQAAGTPVLCLRKFLSRPPFALLVDGVTPRGASALAACLQDYGVRELVYKWDGLLLVTMTVSEAAAWRELGLPAAPLFDLSTRSAPELTRLAQLRRQLRTAHPGENKSGEIWRSIPELGEPVEYRDVTLVAPAWDPVAFAIKPPDEQRYAADLLLNIQQNVQCDFEGVRLWTPPAAWLAELQRRTSGPPEELRSLLARSLDDHLTLAEFDPANAVSNDPLGIAPPEETIFSHAIESLRSAASHAQDPLFEVGCQLLADQAANYETNRGMMSSREVLSAQVEIRKTVEVLSRYRGSRRRPR